MKLRQPKNPWFSSSFLLSASRSFPFFISHFSVKTVTITLRTSSSPDQHLTNDQLFHSFFPLTKQNHVGKTKPNSFLPFSSQLRSIGVPTNTTRNHHPKPFLFFPANTNPKPALFSFSSHPHRLLRRTHNAGEANNNFESTTPRLENHLLPC
uniref:Putative ovule protein n=1 Tax=Solanum chacoense TaxID=4108 RepID=A0A0V0I3E5_SOLCH